MLSRVQPFNVCRLQYYSFAICYLALGVNYFEALSTFFFVLKLKISCNVVLSLCDFLVLVVFSYLNRSKYLAFLFFFWKFLDLDMEEEFHYLYTCFFRIHVCGFSLNDPSL